MNDMVEYIVQTPLNAVDADKWHDTARATTPEGAAELIRVLLTHRNPDTVLFRVDVRTSQEIGRVS
jgi:hypothetical protein